MFSRIYFVSKDVALLFCKTRPRSQPVGPESGYYFLLNALPDAFLVVVMDEDDDEEEGDAM